MTTTSGQHDESEFLCIVQRSQGRLAALATRLLNGDRDLALDVVQDVYLALWRRRTVPDGWPEDVERYLLRSVHNRCVDLLRRRVDSGPPPPDDAPDIAEGPARAAEARSLAAAVQRAVARLPLEQRSVFILSHYDGLSYREIAEVLDCPIGTVASRKNAAVKMLRVLLWEWTDGANGTSEGKR